MKIRPLSASTASIIANLPASFNETTLTITDSQDKTIAWDLVDAVVAPRNIDGSGIKVLEVEVIGPSSRKAPAVRALQSAGFRVQRTPTQKMTPIPATLGSMRLQNDNSDDTLGTLGRAMSRRLMSEVAAKHPDDSVVMFLIEDGTYITAKDDTALLDKYETLHHDKWGWVTDIVRGPSGGVRRVGRP